MVQDNTDYERRGDLIRAPIRTRLGAVVLRWVRPDNPNIVVRPATGAAPAPEPVEEMPKSFEGSNQNCACCGAVYYRGVNDVPQKWTPELIEKAWTDCGYKGLYDRYMRQSEVARMERDKKYYADAAYSYSLEVYTKNKYYETTKSRRVDGRNLISYGVIMCSDPFPDYTVKTPGGMYMKKCREPVSKATKDVYEAAAKPKFAKDLEARYFPTGSFPFADEKTVCLLGGVTGGPAAGKAMLVGAKKAGAGVGCRVIAIFNQDQRNGQGKVTPQAIADAGFTEVIRTGNSNHPTTSTLYVYERVIQEGDYDAL